jgi:hypothetical protein
MRRIIWRRPENAICCADCSGGNGMRVAWRMAKWRNKAIAAAEIAGTSRTAETPNCGCLASAFFEGAACRRQKQSDAEERPGWLSIAAGYQPAIHRLL